ncbi:MAG TPA: tetratricopeptide repeat protein [Tepidisphaeraceae bacterium]|nr:tetratricopeptide repeat protein [Tepidisphaeraceae bacterium]
MTTQDQLIAAVGHHKAGQFTEAESICRQILSIQADHPVAWNILGIILMDKRDFTQSIDCFSRALELHPNSPDFLSNRALCFRAMGKIPQAIADLQQAIKINPNDAGAHLILGNTLAQAERFKDAAAAYEASLRINPNFTDAMLRLASLYQNLGRHEEAIELFRKVLAIDPACVNAHADLAASLNSLGKADQAIASLRKAIDLEPNRPQLWGNLASYLFGTGDIPASLTCNDRALAIDPRAARIHSAKIGAMHFHPDFSAKEIFDETRKWNSTHAAPLASAIRPHDNDRSPDRPLRIGYVSPDFRDHVVGWNALRLARGHHRDQFQVFCYSNDTVSDHVTALFRDTAVDWRSIANLSDDRAAQMIRDDRIDILVDLSLHTFGNRLLLFARKPAPVQVSYLGYCGSTGLDAIDYRLSDPHIDATEAEAQFHAGTTIRLPNCYWCYRPGRDDIQVSTLPAKKNGFVTLISLNNPAKISSATLDVWANTLAQVPQSRMIVYYPNCDARRRVAERLPQGRVEFVGGQQVANYLRTYHRADIALDTTPFNGGITTCDCLWMGLPIVTLSGRTSVGRAGKSIVSNIGQTQWIAATPDQFVQIAADLASDLSRLATLRASLRGMLRSSPVMDEPRFINDIESAFRQMWLRWLA